MNLQQTLEHVTKVCVRNDDGSLTLGTYEVQLLEGALYQIKDKQEVIVSAGELAEKLGVVLKNTKL